MSPSAAKRNPWADNVLKRLANKELILPFLENQFLADDWPLKYLVEVDSGPYYGLDEDGNPDGYFHPSTHPLRPARQLYYEFHPEHSGHLIREPNTLQRAMALALGTAAHAVLQTQLKMTGLCQDDDIETEYINTDHWVRGRADFIAHHPTEGPVLADIKTINPYGWKTTFTPKPEWEAQLSLGCDNLSSQYNTDFTFGIVLLVEMAYPFKMKEIRVSRNDALLSEIYTKFDGVREAIAQSILPRFCCMPDSPEMKLCPARYQCHLKGKEQS